MPFKLQYKLKFFTLSSSLFTFYLSYVKVKLCNDSINTLVRKYHFL